MRGTTSLASSFVNRQKEMGRIATEMEKAAKGESQFICIKGEAGSGKTRVVEEAAAEAGRHGFSTGFGTALAESVIPFHAWTEVLRGFDLAHLLDEAPPPRLLGLYQITASGEVAIRIERKGEDRLGDAVSTLAELVRGPDSFSEGVVVEGALSVLGEGSRRFVVHRKQDFHMGAMVDGREDEIFLSDLRELADTIQSTSGESSSEQDLQAARETSMQQLLDSGKYEGIDYAKENPKLRQSRLFENITLGLARKAGVQPICIAIDDLQWADPSTLALLHYVIRNTRKEGVLTLGTCRVEAEGLRPHLEEILREVEEDLLSVVNLEGLSRKDLPLLAESFLGPHDLPESFLDNLWQETQGYPLFIREVLRGLEEDDSIRTRGVLKRLVRPLTQLGLPEMVREVVQARLDRLPKEERRLLDAAATCGTRFTAALVAKVTGEEEGNVLNGLKAIMEVHGLLRPMGDDFAFDHPTVQEALYEEVPSGIRRTYHRQAAEWLELTGGPAEDVAEHYYRARDPRAGQRLRKVAGSAREKYANDEAIRFYTEALELEKDSQQRRRILESLASIHTLTGNYERSMSLYRDALSLADEKRKRSEILSKIAMIHDGRGEHGETAKMGAEALALVVDEECQEESIALGTIGIAHANQGKFSRALDYCKKSVQISEKLGNEKTVAQALLRIGACLLWTGDYDSSLEYLDKSLSKFENLEDTAGTAGCLNNIGILYLNRGDEASALEYWKQSLRLFERMGDPHGVASVLNNIAIAHFTRGEFDAALRYAERSLRMSERIGDEGTTARTLGSMGNIYRDRGDYDQALEFLERALMIKEKIGDQAGFAGTLNNMGMVYERKGDFDRALEHYHRSVQISERIGNKEFLANHLCNIGRVHTIRGDFDLALENLERALAIWEKMGDQADIADVLKVIALVHKERGKYDRALEDYMKSFEIEKELAAVRALNDTYCGIAEVHLARGDLETALDYCNLALSSSIEGGWREQIAESRRILGMVDCARGRWEEAAENLQEAGRIRSEAGELLGVARVQYELGLMWKKKGDTTKAREHLNAAIEIFEELNLKKDLEEAKDAYESVPEADS